MRKRNTELRKNNQSEKINENGKLELHFQFQKTDKISIFIEDLWGFSLL